jgi:hypothetical protein
MPEKVARANLPFPILNVLEKETRKQTDETIKQGLAVIAAHLQNTQPDPDEGAITGTLAKSTVTLTEQKKLAAQALRDLERRTKHGAPTTPAQLNEEQIKELTLSLPGWDGGALRLPPTRKPAAGPAEETTTPTHLITYGDLDAEKLRQALLGQGPTPKLTKGKGSDETWTTEGSETVFAAMITQLPAIPTLTTETDTPEPTDPDPRPTLDPQELETTALKRTAEETYHVPATLEPLAELARATPLEEFRRRLQGARSPKEAEARATADQREAERIRAWTQLYEEQRRQGQTPEQASRSVRDLPKWRRLEDRAAKAAQAAAELEKTEDEARAQTRAAALLALDYAKEDETNLPTFSLTELHQQARQGKPQEPPMVSNAGLGWAYQLDQDVEVRDLKGNWAKATVIRAGGGEVRIRRDDQQTRTITDPTAIRLPGQGKLRLDNGQETMYNEDMAQINIPVFNVTIPAGSNSAKIEHALTPITAEMNASPLKVNAGTWEKNRDQTDRATERLNAECHQLAGKHFRPNATRDCVQVLFEERGLPVQRVNKKTNQPSVDEETLKALDAMGDDPLPAKIMEARQAQSCLSQLNAWEHYARAGEVQATWNQLGTPHGRYSCDSPNLQNRIVEIRETIEAPDGHQLLSIDQGQTEYRTWASLSGDPTLQAAFASGADFHTKMFEELLAANPGLNLHRTEPRQQGKTINFALLYLMQPFVLGRRMGLESETAQQVIRTYQERAPIATAYIEDYLKQAQRTGQTSTKFGRTRYMPELKTAKGPALHQARKTAWHHHNAGTAAEILKLKQVQSHRRLRATGLGSDQVRVALNMFDEIVFSVREEDLAKVTEIVDGAFNEPIPGFIPFTIDRRTGKNWRQTSK